MCWFSYTAEWTKGDETSEQWEAPWIWPVRLTFISSFQLLKRFLTRWKHYCWEMYPIKWNHSFPFKESNEADLRSIFSSMTWRDSYVQTHICTSNAGETELMQNEEMKQPRDSSGVPALQETKFPAVSPIHLKISFSICLMKGNECMLSRGLWKKKTWLSEKIWERNHLLNDAQ